VAVIRARASSGDDEGDGVGAEDGEPAPVAHDSEEIGDAMQGRQGRKKEHAFRKEKT